MNIITFITILFITYAFYYLIVIGIEIASRKRLSADSGSAKVDFVVAPVTQPVKVVSEKVLEDFEQYAPVVETAGYSRELDSELSDSETATDIAQEIKPPTDLLAKFGIETVQNNYSGYKLSDESLRKHLFHK